MYNTFRACTRPCLQWSWLLGAALHVINREMPSLEHHCTPYIDGNVAKGASSITTELTVSREGRGRREIYGKGHGGVGCVFGVCEAAG